MMDELLQLYCFAEDLDTLEHAAKEVADFLAGPVSRLLFSTRVNAKQNTRVAILICWTMYDYAYILC